MSPQFGHAVTPINGVADITPERIGEFITISGTTANFRSPRERREPYSFQLRDSAGGVIRVCAWPEMMTAIKGWQDLYTTGTAIRVTAEVTDHDGQYELQIQDWEEVTIQRDKSQNATTSATQIMQLSPTTHETTGVH